MHGYRVATRAKRDLAEIHAFIKADSLDAANRVIEQLYEKFELLGTAPQLGTLRPNYRPANLLGTLRPNYRPANLRTFSVNRYVIVYRDTKSIVQIVRVLHGARNIDQLMK